jgi:hypothetical protein
LQPLQRGLAPLGRDQRVGCAVQHQQRSAACGLERQCGAQGLVRGGLLLRTRRTRGQNLSIEEWVRWQARAGNKNSLA